MAKTRLLATGLIVAILAGASHPVLAQQDPVQTPAPDTAAQRGGAGVRGGNITSTGATVPNPGASQSAGTTDLDRGIQRQDDKIQSGICKGC